MRNEKGVILALTLSLVLVFILLGIAAIYFSGLQSQQMQKGILSAQAFWLAEAGVQEAFFNLPDNPAPGGISHPLGNGNFYYVSQDISTPPAVGVRWQIDSDGNVLAPDGTILLTRRIQAIVGPNVWRAITTTGTLSAPGSGGLDDQIEPDGSYEEKAILNFKNVFGIYEEEMIGYSVANGTNYVYDDKAVNPVFNNNGVIWISWNPATPPNKKILQITNADWNYSGILIVEGDVNMEGGHFDGVIWIKGGLARINGNNIVSGSVFVNDLNTDEDTRINGTSSLSFDDGAIDQAFSYISNNPETFHNISSWQED